jgi:acyl carrier protein
MTDDEIFQTIQAAMRTAFDLPELTIRPDTIQANIPGWDSIANVGLSIELERRFEVEIDPVELESIACVADLVQLIRAA